jgi:hypothetical protein
LLLHPVLPLSPHVARLCDRTALVPGPIFAVTQMLIAVIITIVLTAVGSGCGDSRKDAPTQAPAAQFDPRVQPTAKEFARRLTQYNGRLLGLSLTAGRLDARWNSGKCEHFEPEVIDLVISVHRTIKESPTIAAQRDCNGDTRTFTIAASRFQQYRTGKINDSQILADTKPNEASR